MEQKHKFVKKESQGMEFGNFSQRINFLNDIIKFGKEVVEKLEQHQFIMVGGRIEIQTIQKSRFVQINDKRFYFSDGIVLLSFSHPSLKTLIDCKDEKIKR